MASGSNCPRDKLWRFVFAMTPSTDHDTSAQPQSQAMGAARRDPRRGETAHDARQRRSSTPPTAREVVSNRAKEQEVNSRGSPPNFMTRMSFQQDGRISPAPPDESHPDPSGVSCFLPETTGTTDFGGSCACGMKQIKIRRG